MFQRNLFVTLTFLAVVIGALSARAAIVITEVAPWSSGNSPVADDWFEVTNTGPSAVTGLTTWRMDDNTNSITSSVPLSGISSIAAGESVIFIEVISPHTAAGNITAFKNVWFNGSPPPGLQIGTYTGASVGLSTSGDAVNLFNDTQANGGTLQANVSFGAADGIAPFQTFDNAAGLNNTTISLLSVSGVNGAFVAATDANEIGSPGVVPEPASMGLLVLGVSGALVRRRKQVQ